MLFLRFVALVALVLWVGGLAALGGIAAPAVFDVLAARHVADGRLLAGALVAEMLRRFFYLSCAAAVAVLVSLALRRILGPTPRLVGVRAGVLVVMSAAAISAQVVVGGRIAALQATMTSAPSSLPAADPRRAEFGRLHAIASGLQLVPLLGGLALIFCELKD